MPLAAALATPPLRAPSGIGGTGMADPCHDVPH